MTEFTLTLERLEEGHVRVTIADYDEMNGVTHVVWSCEANVDCTRKAQTEALKATFNYLNRFVDMSQGGRA